MTSAHRELRHPSGVTTILSGSGVLEQPPSDLEDWLAGRTVVVLASEHVQRLQGHRLARLLEAADRALAIEVPDGESAKQLEIADRVWRSMLEQGCSRETRVLTFGGGSTGDLGGFVAGCFMRGIEYLQVPTTLLAQVDASIGGKTGVDLPESKNSVGLFHHPRWVVADSKTLSTLDPGEVKSGLVEVVKMAALLDGELFESLERQLEHLFAANVEALDPVIKSAIDAKCSVVESDPGESGHRKVLNFGHTLGHAIEAELDYRGLRHGEAVAYGMLFALRLARLQPWAAETNAVCRRLGALLERFELPSLPPLDAARLCGFVGRDKKATAEGVTWVLARALGVPELVNIPVSRSLESEINGFLRDPWAGIGSE